MKMKTLMALAVAGAFAFPFAAMSADDDKRVTAPTPTGSAGVGANEPPRLDVLDLNNDGQISAEEARRDQMLTDRFGDYDKDRDGMLSRAEQDEYNRSAAAGGSAQAQRNLPAPAGGPGVGAVEPPRLQVLDIDNDGHITAEEAGKDERVSSRFRDLDANNDGRISSAEWQAYERSPAAGGSGRWSGNPPSGASNWPGTK